MSLLIGKVFDVVILLSLDLRRGDTKRTVGSIFAITIASDVFLRMRIEMEKHEA